MGVLVNKKDEVIKILSSLITEGTHIYEIRFTKQDGELVLQVHLDCSGGIGLDECARIHRAFMKAVDGTWVDEYQVQFSSPGISRKCEFPWDFLFYPDRQFVFQLQDGREYTGFVSNLNESEASFCLKTNQEEVNLTWKQVKVCNFYTEF